jgi:hypothetical protein
VATDRKMDEALNVGRRNQEVKELIQNWCGHARIEKVGGTGLIEQSTGYPIGHHSMDCDHAPANGMGTWQLEDAALGFHDANCVGCEKRIPIRLPNLGKLVAQRDNDLERVRRENAEREARLQAEYERRKIVRDNMRGGDSVGSAMLGMWSGCL